MKNQTFFNLITNKWTQLYSTSLFWTVSNSLKFTHLTFYLKRPWINTEIYKNKKINHFMHNYTQMNTTLTQITILNTFIKSDILTLPLTLPKNHIKIFKNQKSNATSQTPIQYTTIHQYTSFTKYLYLQRYRPISISIPHIFCTSKFELFDLVNSKI